MEFYSTLNRNNWNENKKSNLEDNDREEVFREVDIKI